MVPPPKNLETFDSFTQIVEALFGPDGCPWDKEQTHRSLAPYAIEESFELAEAIEKGSTPDVVEELGDVLLQVFLHAEMGRLEGAFTLTDVIRSISEKMVRRHPHVFSSVEVRDSQDVLMNWAKVKAAEKALKGETQKPTAFDLPKALPALQRAHKIGDKTAKVGFDWPDAKGVFAKVEEELEELREEFKLIPQAGSPPAHLAKSLELEIGDVLFSVSQLARHLGLDAEQCLRVANSRFESRYFHMLNSVESSGRNWDSLKADEKEIAWQNAKRDLSANS